uniref:Uncharacterized protein n=1 Tax=Anguilla anguilla TaxID=7936 RepID=A0A0E9TQ47_ANGAN
MQQIIVSLHYINCQHITVRAISRHKREFVESPSYLRSTFIHHTEKMAFRHGNMFEKHAGRMTRVTALASDRLIRLWSFLQVLGLCKRQIKISGFPARR